MSAYLVSQKELLEWINSFLHFSYKSVEECATGAVYCQFMDALFPGSFPLHKVVWEKLPDMRQDDKLKNWKTLQNTFKKHKVSKPINMTELVKAKRVHNLPFCQWFYQFFWEHWTGDQDGRSYAAVERREEAMSRRQQTRLKRQRRISTASTMSMGARPRSRPYSRQSSVDASPAVSRQGTDRNLLRAHSPPLSQRSSQRSASPTQLSGIRRHSYAPASTRSTLKPAHSPRMSSAQEQQYRSQIKKMKSENRSLSQTLEDFKKQYAQISTVAQDIEKERDLYFKTLLKVEETIKRDAAGTQLGQSLLNILYQTSQPDSSPSQ